MSKPPKPQFTDPQYMCNFCLKNAHVNLRVFSIRKTILYESFQKKNACDECFKEELKSLYESPQNHLLALRDAVIARIPRFNTEYITTTNSFRIMGKLIMLDAITNVTTEGEPSAKRMKMDTSTESGSSTTLALMRGTLSGGGPPKKDEPHFSEPSDSDPESPARTAAAPRSRNVTPPHIDDSESDFDEEPDYENPPRQRVPRQATPPRSNRRSPPGAKESISAGIAPMQVPRQRIPHEDGLRTISG